MCIIFERKKILTDYGKKIKVRLAELDRTQEWLISEVKKKKSGFIDSSYLNRIMTGGVLDSVYVPIINQILDIK